MPPQTAQPSFIPREAPQMGESRMQRAGGLVELLILISIVLFVASIALGVGVFLYQEYLQSSITSKQDQLQRAKAAFEPSLISELTRLDDRMRSGSQILSAHIAPSAFFAMLEQETISTITYKSLDFEAGDAQHMTIHMDGVAGSVNSIALQADLFSKGGVLSSPIFSNINRAPDGVHFSLSANLNPSGINYEQLMVGPTAQTAAAAQTQPSSVFGTPAAQTGAPQKQQTQGGQNVPLPQPPAQTQVDGSNAAGGGTQDATGGQ